MELRKIVSIIRPFDRQQNIYVYEDGNKLETASATIQEMEDIIFTFVDKYNISQIDLVGPKQYLKGLQRKIEKTEFTKYNQNKLEINII